MLADVKLLITVVLVAAACGPVRYVGEVTRGAATSFDRATALQADKHSPYHYTRAKEYLRAAREDAARADFQGANRFGLLAHEAADKAVEEAIAAGARGEKPSEAKTVDDEKPAEKLAPVKE